MLSFEKYMNIKEGSYSDKIVGQGITGGLGISKSVAGSVAEISKAFSIAFANYKNRTISFLRTLNDKDIDAILDEMNAGELNRVRSNLSRSYEKSNKNDILSPNSADSHGSDEME